MTAQMKIPCAPYEENAGDEALPSLKPGRLYELLLSDAKAFAFEGKLTETISKLEQAAQFVDQKRLQSATIRDAFEDVVLNA